MRGALPRSDAQLSFDELGQPLRDTVFVVLDLETTGGSAATERITEVGAVRVRGGEVLAELQTLVNPGTSIPPLISVLTGITDAMVAQAPRIGGVLPSVLGLLAGDAVLVAHNAPFDVGFLKAACEREGLTWPAPRVLDTARLARRVLTRDEAPDCKLATLARVLRARTTPTHRALDDARATVDVLHSLIERLGRLGVHSMEELASFSSRVSPAQRAKRHLAAGLPAGPGVYLFRDGRGRVLYVGTSRDVRRRVRQYFVASEPRTRMAEMVAAAERVDAVPCAHALEASIRELRLIAEHAPRYNRRSKHPERVTWIALTNEAFPRLSIVRQRRADGGPLLGPFTSAKAAEAAVDALHETFPIRRCKERLSPHRTSPACALAGMGRCLAPCQHPDRAAYAVVTAAAGRALVERPDDVVDALRRRMSAYSADERYEEAGRARDRFAAYVRTLGRQQRLAALAAVSEIVAAAPRGDGGWDLAVIRHGRLAAATVAVSGAAVWPHLPTLRAAADSVAPAQPADGPTPRATAAEMELLLAWLESGGTRLVDIRGTWSLPAWGAAAEAARLGRERAAVDPFADRRSLKPSSRLLV